MLGAAAGAILVSASPAAAVGDININLSGLSNLLNASNLVNADNILNPSNLVAVDVPVAVTPAVLSTCGQTCNSTSIAPSLNTLSATTLPTQLTPVAVAPAPATVTVPATAVNGITGYEIVEGEVKQVPVDVFTSVEAVCPAGKKAVGGGYAGGNPDVSAFINFSLDGSNGAGWEVWLTNDGSADTTGQAYAICVDSAS
ncbi:hypothetical protein [Catellatospora methionotrophica]|uniref:hypothetical protein n=1 Tax=Catellatospora methionotrophica TaxID=121620 RepID=UPI0034001D32